MTLSNLGLCPVDDLVDVLDGVGIADTGHAHVALAYITGAFQLDFDTAVDRNELGVGDTAGLLVVLLIDALAHVHAAAGNILIIRVGTLVPSVSGYRSDGTALEGGHSGNFHIVLGDGADDRFLSAVGLTAEGGALQNLTGIVGNIFGEAFVDRGGCEHAGIAGTASDDNIGTHLESLNKGMYTGDTDDTGGGIQLLDSQIAAAIQTLDLFTGQHLLAQVLLIHF